MVVLKGGSISPNNNFLRRQIIFLVVRLEIDIDIFKNCRKKIGKSFSYLYKVLRCILVVDNVVIETHLLVCIWFISIEILSIISMNNGLSFCVFLLLFHFTDRLPKVKVFTFFALTCLFGVQIYIFYHFLTHCRRKCDKFIKRNCAKIKINLH